MVDFIPPSAAGALTVLPEYEIPRLKLALLYLHIVYVAVISLLRRTSPEVSAEVWIDLIDCPADKAGAACL